MMRIARSAMLAVAVVAMAAGCSSRQVYEGRQHGVQNDCRRLPPAQVDACLEQNSQSYEEYRREREALEKR